MRIKVSYLRVILFILLSIIFLAIAVGCRPDFVGSDTKNYILLYTHSLTMDTLNTQYGALFNFFSSIFFYLHLSSASFFTFISLINFCSLGLIAFKLHKYLELESSVFFTFLLLLACLSFSPFYYSVQINVIRQGTATISLLLFFLLLLCRNGPLPLIATALFAFGFHKTTIIYLFFSVLTFFSYSFVSITTFVLAFFYVVGLTKKSFFWLSQNTPIDLYDKIYSYGLTAGYNSGNRIDFTCFTIFSGLLFFIIGKYFLSDINQKKFFQLLKIYWILTIPFFLMGFAAFADRYLLPAWFYLSILSTALLLFIMPKSTLITKFVCLVFLCSMMVFYVVVQGLYNMLPF
ncbi:EpsG family protein [Legionella brunensis]|uniref:EpsG family protein n=1 Tax=Legionella brunensis TaxID=29422 RepID=A0A0W0SD64_9GAMM|nr:EpsG family protein [Legionella brunensis]KTC81416.1 hypothetical protein Lbru_1936 [Legionella brunensis]